MAQFVLFHSQQNNSYALLEEGDETNLRLLEPDAQEIWSVEAEDFDIAQLKKHEHLGWQPYKPMIVDENDLQQLVPRHKSDYERAQLLMNLGYPVVKPVAPQILECLQDINWPIAQKLAPWVVGFAEQIGPEISAVLKSDDSAWKFWLLNRVVAEVAPAKLWVFEEMLNSVRNSSDDDREWQVEEEAVEVLQKLKLYRSSH